MHLSWRGKKHGSGNPLRIGIVGSGVAGSSAAYFVRQALGSRAEIVVYERGPTVGGRVRELEVAGRRLPAGASIAHSTNRYFVGLAQSLGLHLEPYPSKTVGVWNGERFDFRTSGKRWRDLVGALSRYGFSPLRAERLVKQFIQRLVPIYDLLEQGRGFTHPRDLFGALGLFELSQQLSRDYFRAQGVSDRFLHEMIDGISRVNYGQASELHALVNLVSLAGAAMGGQLLMVQEGNSRLCRGLLQAAGATLRTGATVVEISGLAGAGGTAPGPEATAGQPGVRYRVSTAKGESSDFAAVIVATPLELAGIRLTGLPLPAPAVLNRPFQTTHVTFVVGQLNPGYFGLRRADQLPGTIMTRETPAIPFSAIGAWGQAADSPHRIYKVFSRAELPEGLLTRLFAERVETHRIVWKAYPVLRPAAEWPPFLLNHGLYYVNAMESGVSTMETEIMASRNVVNLLVQECHGTAAAAASVMTGGEPPR